MKKILLTLILFFSFVSISFAQIQFYKTTAFAQATVYNNIYQWTDWQKSNMNISIDLNSDIIIIYSPITQIYKVYGAYNNGNMYLDNSGGKNIKFYVIDQDGDKGEIRLRVERNGNSQLYVDFSNIAWVYNVVRI